MRFQPSPKVGRAHARIDNRQDDQDDGDDGEGGERGADGVVEVVPRAVLVHPHELEEEVGEAGEVEDLV